MQIKCQCPYCRTKFSVDEEFIGQETECPSCNKNFRIKANVLSRIQLFTAQTYCWGKLYITISRCLAIAIIFSAFIFICIRWLANNHANNVTRQSMAAEYKKLDNSRITLHQQYIDLFTILSYRDSGIILTDKYKPDKIYAELKSGSLSPTLMINSLKNFHSIMQEIQKLFYTNLQKHTEVLRENKSSSREILCLKEKIRFIATRLYCKNNTSKKHRSDTFTIKIRNSSFQPPFYAADISETISRIQQILNNYSRQNSSSFKEEAIDELENLFGKLTNDWCITHSYSTLEIELELLLKKQKKQEEDMRETQLRLAAISVGIFIVAMLLSFNILVAADYLQAHFDIADNTRKDG